MPTADLSQSARTLRKKAQILASWRAANPGKLLQGPGGQTTEYTTTYIPTKLGSLPFRVQAAGPVQTDGPCGCAPRG
jgi:hypothetical protein